MNEQRSEEQAGSVDVIDEEQQAIAAERQALEAEQSTPTLDPDTVPATNWERVQRARTFAKEAANLLMDLKCRDVKVLDVAGMSPVCDVMIMATGASPRQMRAVAEQVTDVGREHELAPMTSFKRADADDRWIALDLIDVVVHIFSEEARMFYDLDSLWGDAPEIHWYHREAATA
jgi:ribosome-associated protein